MRTKYFALSRTNGRFGRMLRVNSQMANFLKSGKTEIQVLLPKYRFVFFLEHGETNAMESIRRFVMKYGVLMCQHCDTICGKYDRFCRHCGHSLSLDQAVIVDDPKYSVDRDVYMADDEVYAARYQGKVAAIKLYRTRTGYDLKRSKEDVEQYMEDCGYKFYNG